MVFENSWLNHLKEEIVLNWFLSGINDWEERYTSNENYNLTQLKEDVEYEITKIRKKCPQCLKSKMADIIK